MKKFKAVPGKGIVASTNTNKKRRPITASSTSDEQMFQKYHNEFINEYENGDAVSDEADIWIEETLMSAVMTAAERRGWNMKEKMEKESPFSVLKKPSCAFEERETSDMVDSLATRLALLRPG